MTETALELDRIALSQRGLVTQEQALKYLSVHQLRHRRRSGRLVATRPGVYRFAGAGDSWESRLLAVTLSTNAVASHRSAARLFGLPVPAERIEVTVPLGRQVRLPGVTAHRSNFMLPEFCTEVAGIPATTVPRTLVDLTAVLGPPTCERALDEADRRNLVTYVDVDACYRRMRRRGRRRVRVMEEILTRRLDGVEPGDSEWEMRLGRWLVEGGYGLPEQGFWLVAGGKRFCVDLAYPEARIAIEYDGWSVHRQRGRYDSDRRKWRALSLAGWTVLPYTSACTRAEVLGEVAVALARSTPTPHQPPIDF